MNIYNSIDDFVPVENAVITIGTFDGVHTGHRKIIAKLQELAASIGGQTVILTFFPHPRMILNPEDQSLKLITTIDEKAGLLEELGIDHLIVTPFSRDFSNMSALEYIHDVLVAKIGIKKIVIGYDHRFGKDRKGGLSDLQRLSKQYDFEVFEIPEQDVNDVAVSSTKIRNALLSDDIALANQFLSYPFFITGKVIRGDQIGRQLGYPTANILIAESYKLIPADGIFAVTVVIDDQTYKGMAYIGHRPTINGMTRNIEVNIFDFERDIYDQTIRMNFHYFVRSDVKFEGLEALKLQLAKDRDAVLELLSSTQPSPEGRA